ncbi:MAG: 2-amino-4-hydroxy-6-hydroxymethyldihydropteridine diphosphokinase [Bacteroidia bacterium]|jgi:2-amino-4-hydroxy-6-hydroxymethyldihydropteridine diphosphokinase
MDRDFEIAHRSDVLVLLLGTNLGDKPNNLLNAMDGLKSILGEPVEISSVYETPPWGNIDQDAFLNMALVYNTNLSPGVLLDSVLNLESELGRVRQEKWGPRLIDIDIIFYGNMVYQSDILEIPHPYMHQRKFVLEPMNEVVPDYVHPLLEKTVSQLLLELIESEENA